ncbi:MAG: PsbP-related protein [Blautia sp.]|nr:hypothetical protein [Blautia sp.]MDY4000535.1 PsbP-related protein [Blautia sp.]
MKNKKVLVILAMAISMSCAFTACGFGSKEEEQVVVDVTPTPEPTDVPEPTPTIAPDTQTSIYTSKDKTISIKLPDATWANKTDETDMISFESPEQGKILILHGAGEEDMSVAVIPSTEDMAVSLEQASDLVQGTDFEIQNYTATDVNGVHVYSYVTKMLNTEKSDGFVYVVNKVFANDEEYYTIQGSVRTEDALSKIKESVDSFAILGDSTLKSAAPGSGSGSTAAAGNTDGAASGSTDGTASANTPAESSDGTDGSQTSGGETSGITNSGGFTQEQLTDTNQTRTIYRNSDGHPLVITPDGNGNWVDFDGNTYEFANDEDVYDQDGVDYYYHGEGADVYYMPVE